MKLVFVILLSFFNYNYVFSKELGQTEITAEEGIEVFQDDKYYLLKKNVNIVSDNFTLLGDLIKVFFEKDLYDVKIIDAVGNVVLNSKEYSLNAKGQSLTFIVDSEKIIIEGKESKLNTEQTEMFSDGIIEVENLKGDFFLNGPNSQLKTESILIKGEKIDGVFSNSNLREIISLNVNDKNIAYIMSDDTEMFAENIDYNKKDSLITLENNVKIISKGETITGDYGTLDTKSNSYKIKSKESKKVRIIISNTDE